jgi:hypothetical protein
MNKTGSTGSMIMGFFVAVGLSLGGYFVGQTMYNAKVALNTAEAKGLAESNPEKQMDSLGHHFGCDLRIHCLLPALHL